MLNTQQIKEWAAEVGFDACGIVPAQSLPKAEKCFREWISAGRHASLGYLERHVEKRFDPTRLMEGTQSVVVCLVNYKSRFSVGYPADCSTKIASYALNRDYHLTLKEMLCALLERLQQISPSLRGRAFTDSAPLGEKSLAEAAGLGWRGRQSLLVTPRFGTYVLLGELLLTESCDVYDRPFEGERCGGCRACVEACPVGAIGEDRMIDARRCIACRTIEKGVGEESLPLDGWIFGCDRCQQVCPHNRPTPLATHPQFQPLVDPLPLTPERWLAMRDEEFSQRFGSTPLTRAGLEMIRQKIKK